MKVKTQATSSEPAPPRARRGTGSYPGRRLLAALIPTLLIGGLIVFLVAKGPAGIFPGDFPPVEDLSIQRVTFAPGEIRAAVTNGGPEPVTVAQVLVDEAYWTHTVEPSRTIPRLKGATVAISYPWVEGEPVEIKLVTSTGLTFPATVDVATETPRPDARFLTTFGLLGLYIGLIPVAIGMASMPLLRTLSPRWLHFFMAFTAGILAFLGFEALDEAFEASGELPTAFGGAGVVAVAALGSFLVILAGARLLQRRAGADARLVIAYTVAGGIGLHNLGEGLAVGAAYALGEIALGAFLVIGFAIHNTTEGIGIVSILGSRAARMKHLILLGLLAGVPTIFGAWAGAFAFSPILATVFLAIAAGAIAEVIVDILRLVREEAPDGLTSLESLGGIAMGLAVMYTTGLLVAA
ncbi:MAG: ZIP family metal transporter [Actinomycetota bacterium]